MNISGNSSITMNDMWKLHNKTNRTSAESEIYHSIRRENPELDRALYDYDKAQIFDDILSEDMLKRYILGYDLSENDKENIKAENPELLDKVLSIKDEKNTLELEISNAGSTAEMQSILSNAMMDAAEKGKTDETYLEYKKLAIKDLADKYIAKDNSQYSSYVNNSQGNKISSILSLRV